VAPLSSKFEEGSAVSEFESIEDARAASEARESAARTVPGRRSTTDIDAALRRYLAAERYVALHEGDMPAEETPDQDDQPPA